MELDRVFFTIWIRRLLLIVTLSFSVIWISENGLSYGQVSTLQDYIDKADSLYDQGQYEEAITYYDRALAIDPKNEDVLNNKVNALDSLADDLRYSGKYKEAIELFDKALAIDPKNVDTLREKAYVFVELRQFEDAIQNYDKALAIDPKNVWTLLDKANTLRDSGRYEDAIDSFDNALAINSTFIFALNGKAAVLSDLGRYEEAIRYYDKALAIKPDDVWTLRDKALTFSYLGRYGEAIELIDKAIAVSPILSDDDNDKNTVMNLYSDKGVILHDLGKYEEAITYYDKALAIEPTSIFNLYNKGLALSELGRFNEAIMYYDKVLAIDPEDVDTLNNKIAALSALTPDFKPASFSGNVYQHSRGYVFVSNHITVTTTTTTTTPTTSNAASCENIQELVDMGLKLKPDDVKILTNGGKNLAEKCGKYQESIPYYDRALAVDANYVPALYNKGVSMEKLGNHDEAQQLFDKATEIYPSYRGDFVVGSPRLSKPLPSPI